MPPKCTPQRFHAPEFAPSFQLCLNPNVWMMYGCIFLTKLEGIFKRG